MSKLNLIHPFVFALYPTLFLYSQNINRFREDVIINPLVISFIFAAITFSICLIIVRKLQFAAAISSLLTLITFSYSRIADLIKNIQFNFGRLYIGPDKILFVIILLILATSVFLIMRNKTQIKKVNNALSIISFVLIAITFINISKSELKMNRSLSFLQVGKDFLSNIANQTERSQDLAMTNQTPDIYYFILDRYAGEKTLAEYDFDNSAFLNFLKQKGFYIASEATSNYPKTFLSLGSTLNMDYLDFLTEKTNGGATSDESPVTPMVQNNKIIKFLKSKGYSYIHVGSGWDPTRSNPNANQNFIMTNGRYPFADEFTSGLLQTTIASPILKKLYPDSKAVSRNPKNNDHRSRVLYEFDTFNQIPEIKGPKFVFAHILIPHDPYVLDKNCKPLTEKTTKSKTVIENYLNQLSCTNLKMEVVINQILTKSQATPIIIIQADEGPLPIKNPVSGNLNWKDASDATLKEKFPILSAYLLPNTKEPFLYPSITPVNSFRVIFNQYFNTNLPLLPDRNIIFENDKSYYKFIDVTERLKTN